MFLCSQLNCAHSLRLLNTMSFENPVWVKTISPQTCNSRSTLTIDVCIHASPYKPMTQEYSLLYGIQVQYVALRKQQKRPGSKK